MRKVILFDADGVMTHQQPPFSVYYCRQFGIDFNKLSRFFETDWKDYVTGEKDLKVHIEANHELWQWQGAAEELIQLWLEFEDTRNQEMIELVSKLRHSNIPCFLATEQEYHRGEYMKNVMFKDVFDGYFITAEIGHKKSDIRFFEAVLGELKQSFPDIEARNVIFFDDSQSKVDAALSAGIDGVLFNSYDSVITKLRKENMSIKE